MKLLALSLLTIIVLLGCRHSDKVADTDIYSSIAMCAPAVTDREWYNSDKKAPLFEGMGELHYPITTDDTLAQKYFDQGLVLAYGFNHAEAARSFHYATRLDTNCAMAYWGFAYVLGPNYNAGMEPDNYERAYVAIQNALKYSEKASVKEQDLIRALSHRYVQDPVDDRGPLDEAYSNEMNVLYQKYPDDADIGVLYVESLMNLHPWDLHDKNGEAREWTPEIISILETIIEKSPNHPGAHHFYIHAVEASSTPERGLPSAELFDQGLVPNSGHLVHMPSHVYIRTGDYHKGTLANIRAIHIDSQYVTACNAQGVYPLAYYPHNQHFLAATATLEGNSKWALYAGETLQKNANKHLMKEPGWGTIQHYYNIPYFIRIKFGKWDDILKQENEFPELDYPTAIFHYARGMSWLGKGDLIEASKEFDMLEKISHKQELKEITIWDINSVYDLVQIAKRVLKAKILFRENNVEQAISLLKEAIEIEDALNYNEPPDWFFSVRHELGAMQLDAGLYRDAFDTYQEDLKNFPKNGWALKGLAIACSRLGDSALLFETESKLRDAWRTADTELRSSVIN